VESKSPHTADVGDGPLLRPPSVAAKLVVVAGVDEGLEVPLDGAAEIGTDPACRLVLADPAVSRRHVRVTVSGSGAGLTVKDLGSKNGTFLGGARIALADVPLGAVLTLGHSQVAIQSRWYVREVVPSVARVFGELSGESLAMREIFAILERVAPTDVTVLVEGESGTGKELVARSIHKASSRASKPYVVFDCGAVPGDLAESELFGHKKGAFSGAVSDRAGAFQRADGGTICLDELGELPLDLQPKLLRVLETGDLRPVEDDTPRKVDVRVVASTNRDLASEVRRGRFRSDLLYRLEVVKIRIPPLRHRPEDVPALVARLLEGRLPPGDVIDGENLAKLVAYSWPGNVRELRNTLARAVTLARRPDEPLVPFGKLVVNLGPASSAPTTIGADFPGVASPLTFKEAKGQLMESFERAYVGALLARHQGNVTKAAAAAGVSRTFLYELMKKTTGEAGDAPGPDDDRSGDPE
jgi:transcriptional regulator with GAF, ATPase, and Fis domain